MSRFIIVAALFSLIGSGLAAESATRTTERVYSANGRFYAELCVEATGTCRADVFLGAGEVQLWTAWVDWRKGYVVQLSDDGRLLAVVNDIYSEAANLVMVYTEQGMKAYSTKSIVITRTRLKLRNSKLVWILYPEEALRFSYDAEKAAVGIELSLVDGRMISLDLQ